ncbi:hypothetical protein L596_019952 [Steinernema carpocapsae]|uniref:Uncharacterized protein n=2 Tax=Steinernema carpocapsae TaxID=34508 RepID=A0A4U5MS42_STECR|nr:hypothetical protein L596_019952 [Steinernema carpocapsae]
MTLSALETPKRAYGSKSIVLGFMDISEGCCELRAEMRERRPTNSSLLNFKKANFSTDCSWLQTERLLDSFPQSQLETPSSSVAIRTPRRIAVATMTDFISHHSGLKFSREILCHPVDGFDENKIDWKGAVVLDGSDLDTDSVFCQLKCALPPQEMAGIIKVKPRYVLRKGEKYKLRVKVFDPKAFDTNFYLYVDKEKRPVHLPIRKTDARLNDTYFTEATETEMEGVLSMISTGFELDGIGPKGDPLANSQKATVVKVEAKMEAKEAAKIEAKREVKVEVVEAKIEAKYKPKEAVEAEAKAEAVEAPEAEMEVEATMVEALDAPQAEEAQPAVTVFWVAAAGAAVMAVMATNAKYGWIDLVKVELVHQINELVISKIRR